MDASLTVSILTGLHVLLAVGLITLILLQQGPGAGMGAAFGSGASGTVFGSRGSGSFLTKSTAVLATVFFLNSIGLAILAGSAVERDSSVLERVLGPESEIPAEPREPAVPGDGHGASPAPARGTNPTAVRHLQSPPLPCSVCTPICTGRN